MGPGPVGEVHFIRVFLRDPSPYLRKFRNKPRKTPIGYFDKRDRGLVWFGDVFVAQAPRKPNASRLPVRDQKRSAISGLNKLGENYGKL